MTVAARLTSTLLSAAQRRRLAAQNWISGVKSWDSAPLPLSSAAGAGTGGSVACGVLLTASVPAPAGGLVKPATNAASTALTHRAANGGSKKPDRQPLLSVVCLRLLFFFGSERGEVIRSIRMREFSGTLGLDIFRETSRLFYFSAAFFVIVFCGA